MRVHEGNSWFLQVGDRFQVSSGPSLGTALPCHWCIILVILEPTALALPAEVSWDAGSAAGQAGCQLVCGRLTVFMPLHLRGVGGRSLV